MRRALDEARAELDSLTDHGAILDCYFAQCRRLFEFAALFVVRGDTAHGRSVFGLGAPDELVSRLSFPLTEPGVLARCREQRRPFITTTSRTDADNALFGSLGRAMPSALVVPLVVRDRVVAIVLGERPAAVLENRASEAGRQPMELAKEEMLVWSEIVGDALERLVLRKKAGRSDSPPALFSSWRPPAVGSSPPGPRARGRDSGPPAGSLRMPPPPSFAPETSLEGGLDGDSPLAESEAAAPESMSRGWLVAIAAGVAVAGALAIAAWVTRVEPVADRVVVPGEKLPGWPNSVDPLRVIEVARAAPGIGLSGELSSIRAESTRSGFVDFDSPAASTTSAMTFTFVANDAEWEVRVDRKGIHAARSQARSLCGVTPCRNVVAAPSCSFRKVLDAAKSGGLLDNDRATVTYASEQDDGSDPVTGFVVAVAGRGEMRIDASCEPRQRERLLPPPTPLAAITGGVASVDSLATLGAARVQSGLEADAVLLEIDARGVGPDGKVDLSKPDNGVSYRFADPPSVAAKRRRVREVKLGRAGMPVATADDDTSHTGAVGPGVRPPVCSFGHAFKTIGELEPGTVAHITFGPDAVAAGPGLWTLDVETNGFHETIGDDVCSAWEQLPSRKK